jgi:hypothetical protein
MIYTSPVSESAIDEVWPQAIEMIFLLSVKKSKKTFFYFNHTYMINDSSITIKYL